VGADVTTFRDEPPLTTRCCCWTSALRTAGWAAIAETWDVTSNYEWLINWGRSSQAVTLILIAHLSSSAIPDCSTSHVNASTLPYPDKVAPMPEPPDALPSIFLPRLDHQSPQWVCAELHCQLSEQNQHEQQAQHSSFSTFPKVST